METKVEVVAALGGTVRAAAAAMGISSQALSMWPAVLTNVQRDRAQAALYRKAHGLPAPTRLRRRAAAQIEGTAHTVAA